MVETSSSHAAGAVKIGSVTAKLIGQPPVKADIFFVCLLSQIFLAIKQ